MWIKEYSPDADQIISVCLSSEPKTPQTGNTKEARILDK